MRHVSFLGLIFAVACARPDTGTDAAPAALGKEAVASTRLLPATLPYAATAPEPDASPEPDEPATFDGVTRVGPHAYEVDRTFLRAKLDERQTLQDAGDAVAPYHWDGTYAGIRFRAVRRRSVLRALGFLSGDVLVSVNGQALENPNHTLELFEALTRDTNLDLGVLRAGRALTFTYEIR